MKITILSNANRSKKMNYKCYLCSFFSETLIECEKHLNDIHFQNVGAREWICLVNNNCDKSYLSLKTLRRHIKQCIEKNPPVITGADEIIHDNTVEENSEECINRILTEIAAIKMLHSNKNKVFDNLNELVNQMKKIFIRLMNGDNGLNSNNAIETATDFITQQINSLASQYKRKKKIEQNEVYVAPVSKAVGTRFEMILCKQSKIERPHLIQCSMQFISPIKQLKAFFSVNKYRDIYFESQQQHECDANFYGCFRCGDFYKESNFFQRNRNAIQLQISTDDFELCNPVGSKSNLHKACAVYMQIRNLPSKYLSRLENMFLVCMSYC